jgi:hypothetical protein
VNTPGRSSCAPCSPRLPPPASRVLPTTGFRHPGDLAWNAALEHEARTAVWHSGGNVLAWAWLIAEPEELMAQVDPDHPALADEVLDWARAGARRSG